MSISQGYVSKTQLYQKVTKPLLERQRRARINKCLDELKRLMAGFQQDENLLRMDKTEILETTLAYMRAQSAKKLLTTTTTTTTTSTKSQHHMDSFRNGYMNAVNEVSRTLASIPGMDVRMGKSVMKHLGSVYNTMQQQKPTALQNSKILVVDCMTAPLSPASSGYHSDSDYDSPAVSPIPLDSANYWRPW